MPIDKSHESTASASVPSDAEDWGAQFVKLLGFEYQELISTTPTASSLQEQDIQRAMMQAVLNVFQGYGMTQAEMIRLMGETSIPAHPTAEAGVWSAEKNARRCALIDKQLQQSITLPESIELDVLTKALRAHFDQEEFVPLEGARELHRRLLDQSSSQGKPR